MKVIIVEDEKPAAEKLKLLLEKVDTTIETQAVLTSVQSAVAWLSRHPVPELIFMDIELTDGSSFRIFDNCSITCPVIFTTAYDEYWQEAFEFNSIDYLLKPIKKDKLEMALKKYHKLREHFAVNLQRLIQWNSSDKKDHKKRLLVKRGVDLISVKTEDIAYFYATHKLVCLVTFANHKYILDQSLSEVERDMDSSLFYRINRKYLVNINAVTRIQSSVKGRLALELKPCVTEEIIISQENAGDFKNWIAS